MLTTRVGGGVFCSTKIHGPLNSNILCKCSEDILEDAHDRDLAYARTWSPKEGGGGGGGGYLLEGGILARDQVETNEDRTHNPTDSIE